MPIRRIDPNRYTNPSLLGAIVNQVRLAWRLLRDPRVPTSLKVLIPALVVLYTLSPIDLVPDFLLGLGQLDDLGVILAALALFTRLAPRAVVAEHQAAMAGWRARQWDDTIEATYSVGGERPRTSRR